MRGKSLETGIILLILIVVAFVGYGAGSLTASDILDRMSAAVENLNNLSAVISVQTYKDGEVSLTQQMRLALAQPDKMRLEYLKPEYLAGNVTLVVGEKMWMYIAVTDQWIEKDLSNLPSAQQPWLMFRNILRGVRSMLDDYKFARIDEEGDIYHIRGIPASDAAVYGRIELWVDPETFVPVRRTLYDMDGNLLMDTRFHDAREVVNGVVLPLTIETYDAEGKLASVVSYVQITVNAGVPDDLFNPPVGNDG